MVTGVAGRKGRMRLEAVVRLKLSKARVVGCPCYTSGKSNAGEASPVLMRRNENGAADAAPFE